MTLSRGGPLQLINSAQAWRTSWSQALDKKLQTHQKITLKKEYYCKDSGCVWIPVSLLVKQAKPKVIDGWHHQPFICNYCLKVKEQTIYLNEYKTLNQYRYAQSVMWEQEREAKLRATYLPKGKLGDAKPSIENIDDLF